MATVLTYTLINMIIACAPQCRYECCKVHAVIYESIYLLLALAMVVFACINYSNIDAKATSLLDWSEYADCVDAYMQINSYEVSKIEKVNKFATAQVWLSFLITFIHFFDFFVASFLCYNRDKTRP